MRFISRVPAHMAVGAGALALFAASITSAQNTTPTPPAQSTLGAPPTSQNATLRVDLNRLGAPISPTLYGVFFEEINHAGDGGIYAELVRNRSFEDGETPQGWSLVAQGRAKGNIGIDTTQPLNANQKRSLRVDVSDASGGGVGVANEGYWGIPIRQGKEYQFSFHARCNNLFNNSLQIALESVDGRVLAQSSVQGLSCLLYTSPSPRDS